MRIRSFKVPFDRVLPEGANELEFGPDDYLVVRPIFGLSADEVNALVDRMKAAESEDDADALYADVVKLTVVEWHLADANGVAIELPATREAARRLPGALAGALYPFLTEYRGDANPTTPR